MTIQTTSYPTFGGISINQQTELSEELIIAGLLYYLSRVTNRPMLIYET
ncbi:MAG: hypothetical protein SGI73_02715 [Chloroflexota bacterium]|nr:hypothetical protein [Chloroflexota bacterium]